MIHENPKEAESDVFQELYSLQILLILPDPNMSFELEHWLRCKYWKEMFTSWFGFSSDPYIYVYMYVFVCLSACIGYKQYLNPGFFL